MTTPPAPGKAEAHDWKLYSRLGEIEAREWTWNDTDKYRRNESTVSVSAADVARVRLWIDGDGGMVARNPANHLDQWYIAPDYFAKHYAPVSRPAPAIVAEVGDDPTDTREFYELMQTYRHTHIVAQADVVKAYDAVREFVRRTLAEKDDAHRQQIEAMRSTRDGMHRELAAATQRAEQAERLLREINEYLSGNLQNSIWSGSRLHQDVKRVLALPAPATNATGEHNPS